MTMAGLALMLACCAAEGRRGGSTDNVTAGDSSEGATIAVDTQAAATMWDNCELPLEMDAEMVCESPDGSPTETAQCRCGVCAATYGSAGDVTLLLCDTGRDCEITVSEMYSPTGVVDR